MRVLVASLLVALVSAACSPRVEPDLILHNGKVFTADRDGLWAEAIAVSGSNIVAVGGTEEILATAGAATRIIDAGGRVIVPGFNDAHYHVSSAIPHEWLELGDDPSLDVVLDSIRSAVGRTPAGTWVWGAIGATVFDDPRTGRAALDAVAPDHPVMLDGWTGHGRWINSAARAQFPWLGKAGWGGWTEPGGDGSEDSFLYGYEGFRATAQLQRGVDSVTIARMARLQAGALEMGITSFQAMAFPMTEQVAMAALEAAGLRVRWSFIRLPLGDDAAPPAGDAQPDRSALFTRGGAKYILDGTPEERMMRLRLPFADRPGWSGRSYLDEERLGAAVDHALAAGEQLSVHAVGDSAISLLFQAMQRRQPEGWQARRVRVEHGDVMAPDLIATAAALGAVVVQNPSHLTVAGMLNRRLGADRMATVQPMRSLVEAGVPLALGSDGPLSPFLNIMFAVIHPANPAEALSVEEAVIAYTRGSAYAQFAETEKGRIRPGLLADLAVLSQDIFTIAPDQLPATTSLLTLVGGRIEHAAAPFEKE